MILTIQYLLLDLWEGSNDIDSFTRLLSDRKRESHEPYE